MNKIFSILLFFTIIVGCTNEAFTPEQTTAAMLDASGSERNVVAGDIFTDWLFFPPDAPKDQKRYDVITGEPVIDGYKAEPLTVIIKKVFKEDVTEDEVITSVVVDIPEAGIVDGVIRCRKIVCIGYCRLILEDTIFAPGGTDCECVGVGLCIPYEVEL